MTSPIPEECHFFVAFRAQMRIASRLIWQDISPATTYAVFIEALCELEHGKGLIRLQPRKLADELGLDEDSIMAALDRLESHGIFIPHPEGWNVANKLAVNPHLAWKGRPTDREVSQRRVRPIRERPSTSDKPGNLVYLSDLQK